MTLFGVACSDASGNARRPCEEALADDDRPRALEVCVGPEWQPHARLAEAWLAYDAGERDKALSIATTLFETVVGAEAALIAGLVEGPKADAQAEARGRRYLQRALESFQRTGDHKRAARAAMGLSRAPRPDHFIEDKVNSAQLGLDEAKLSEDPLLIGRSLIAVGDAYDALGKVEEARNHYMKAEEALQDLPDEVAWAWSKHALFLLDMANTRTDLDVVLNHLEIAVEFAERAKASGKGTTWGAFDFAIALNRAVALARQDRYDEADRELDRAGDPQDTKLMMVRGIVAARRGDLSAAMHAFEVTRTGNVEPDYEWNMELELARLHRKAGRIDDAAARYRAAIDKIEEMRSQPDQLKLRPWVLDRRRQPYVELVEMLADAGRFSEALEVGEWLHARTWLDAVLGRTGTGRDAVDDALRDVELASSSPTAPRLTVVEIARLVGTREALVFVTVNGGLWRFHLVNGSVSAQRFGADALDVIETYRTRLADPDRAADILLPAELTDSDEPLIVVGDVAWKSRFAALPWNGRPLVATRATVYLPGLAALQCSAGAWDGRRVLIGDADGDLPEAAGEVARLAKRLSTQAHIGVDATWDVLRTAAGAELLHTAIHVRESDGAMALGLSDADVTAGEILEARIAPKIVVLAGCNTAEGLRTPESWAGFPSAFLASGSRFVISTTQSVEDAAAARFVDAYYQQPDTLDPPRRLAAAQLEVTSSLSAQQWSSFVAWGSPGCDFR
jgi:tetratricopeptide (TPR) repeat protein